jgi:hypothetical protein
MIKFILTDELRSKPKPSPQPQNHPIYMELIHSDMKVFFLKGLVWGRTAKIKTLVVLFYSWNKKGVLNVN